MLFYAIFPLSVLSQIILPCLQLTKSKHINVQAHYELLFSIISNLSKLHGSINSLFLQDGLPNKSSAAFPDDFSKLLSQFVVPQSLVDIIIYHTRDSPLFDHAGRDRSLSCKQNVWPSVKRIFSFTMMSVFHTLLTPFLTRTHHLLP